jgi:hypothetical protein
VDQVGLIGAYPCEGLGNLSRTCSPGDYHSVCNPHQDLELRADDVDVGWPVVIGVHAHRDRSKLLQGRHGVIAIGAIIALNGAAVKHLNGGAGWSI